MTDDIEFTDDTLAVGEDGKVDGSAHIFGFDGEHDVTAAVTSYRYERDGEERINHVPHVVVTERDGTILAEPHARDSADPERAIDHAKTLAEYVARHPGEYV